MRSVEPHVLASSEYFNFSPSALARTYLLHVLSVGEFTYEPGYDLRRSAFDSLLLEIILDGRVNLETEGETLAARAGQVVLIDCTKPHRYWSDTGWHALWVHFDDAAAWGYFQMILRQNGRAFATHRQRSGCEPSVGELARLVGWSEYHFIRVFREMMGVTPRRYIIVNRMSYARYLLKTTARPIGGMVGYASERMFSAAFRRTHGVTPQPVQNRRTASRTGGISMSTASIRVETVLIPTYGVGRADKTAVFLDTTRLYAGASNAHDGWYGHRGGSGFYTATNLRQHQLRAIYAEMGSYLNHDPPMRSMPARPSTPIPCGCIRRWSRSAPMRARVPHPG